jgi:hypothetical protein
MTDDRHDQHRSTSIEVFGALDSEALALVIRLAHSTIRSGCAEVALQLQALTDFPTRLFAELHELDRFARLHHCDLQLRGLDEAVAAVVRTGPEAVNQDQVQLRLEAGHRPVNATRLAASSTAPDRLKDTTRTVSLVLTSRKHD